MKINPKNSICIILSVCIMFFTLISPVFAQNIPYTDAVIKSADNGYIVSIYLKNTSNVDGLDFSVKIPEDTLSFSDIAIKLSQAGDISNQFNENTQFYYHYITSGNTLTFSGFFTNSVSDAEDIHICDISITKNSDMHGTIELNTLLSIGKSSISSCKVYSTADFTLLKESSPEAYPSGDIDRDGKVTASDARLILRTSVKLETIDMLSLPYADTDHNGEISASDARYALRASVGLEEAVLHKFIVRLKNGVTCDKGGAYFFFCTLTNTAYYAMGDAIEHNFTEGNCYHNTECSVCGEISQHTNGHSFNDSGICNDCFISKAEYNDLKETTLTMLQNVINYDITADSAVDSLQYGTFIKNAAMAEEALKKCLDEIKDLKGSYEIYISLELAYKIRFEAFLQCTDENGNIPLTEKSFSIISEAVALSMRYINSIFILLSE